MDKLLMDKKAGEFRIKNELGSIEPIKIVPMLQKLGVITVFKALGQNFAGMSYKHGEFRFMMVNSDHNINRQNFTVCHELYHLFIQEDFLSETSNTERFDRSDRDEYLADVFASHLLLPQEGLLTKIPEAELKKDKISIETVVNIEQHFGCSRTCLLYRLKEINLIGSEVFDKYSKDVIKSAKKLRFTNELYMPGNEGLFIGKVYEENAKELYDKGLISQSHYLEFLADAGQDKF